ncbi:hypothetical protein J6590_042585 [Homalodisca vitripennis]|nr:hypothetical protein J6590_042585 [Homalodisca vitripennis]
MGLDSPQSWKRQNTCSSCCVSPRSHLTQKRYQAPVAPECCSYPELIGLRKPLLIPASSVHVSGTPMQINCSAQPTVPPPHISFYIDDIKVEKTQVRTVKPGLAVLEVLRLSEFEGPLWIRCEASVSGVYHLSSASIPILEQIPLLGQSNGVPLISTLSTCIFLLHFLLMVQYKLTM